MWDLPACSPPHPVILGRFQLFYCMCSSRPKPAHGLPGVGLEEHRQPQLYAKVSRAEPAPCVLIARRLITALPAFYCFLGQAGSRVPSRESAAGIGAGISQPGAVLGDFIPPPLLGPFFFSISISAMKAFTCHQALQTELRSSAAAPWAPHGPLGVLDPPGASCSPLEPWDPNHPPPAPLMPSVSQGKEGRGTRERI